MMYQYKMLGDGLYEVRKMVDGEEKSVYQMSMLDSTCTCKAFQFRGNCKHLEEYSKFMTGEKRAVTLTEARAIVAEMLEHFKESRAKLPVEPYVRREDGKVEKIILELEGVPPHHYLAGGVWEGVLKNSRVVLRLVIK